MLVTVEFPGYIITNPVKKLSLGDEQMWVTLDEKLLDETA